MKQLIEVISRLVDRVEDDAERTELQQQLAQISTSPSLDVKESLCQSCGDTDISLISISQDDGTKQDVCFECFNKQSGQ